MPNIVQGMEDTNEPELNMHAAFVKLQSDREAGVNQIDK
jgi:hypothetical protein